MNSDYDADWDYDERPLRIQEPAGYRDYKFDCPDCGAKNAITQYHKDNHYHCDKCTRNTEQTGGIYGF